MAPDLLSTIRREIDERLSELRLLLGEYEQLLAAADALETTRQEDGSDTRALTAAPATLPRARTQVRTPRRGSAVRAIERASTGFEETTADGTVEEDSAKLLKASDVQRPATIPSSAEKSTPTRAARGAAREAILAALDHGSHTIGELVVVTAMSAPNINGNLRRLLSEGVVAKTEREGKTAWALDGRTV